MASSLPTMLTPLRLAPDGGNWGNAKVRVRELAAARPVNRGDLLIGISIQEGVNDPDAELAWRRELGPTYPAPAAQLVELEEGMVDGQLCVAFTPAGQYVPDSLRSRQQALSNGFAATAKSGLELPGGRETVELDAPAVLVGAPTGGSYFHWLVEALSRKLLVRDLLPLGTRVLVPRLRKMERETMRAAAIPEDAIFEMDPTTVVQVPRLFVPSRGTRAPGRILPAAMAALHRLSHIWRQRDSDRDQRILISRAGARYRRIVNEDELADLLEDRGFTRLALEQLATSEQIDRFARAEVVVGLHGAGFVNTVFMPPGGTLIELQPPELDLARMQLFWNLAASRGHSYGQVVCPVNPAGASAPPASRDVAVDCEGVESVLREAGIR